MKDYHRAVFLPADKLNLDLFLRYNPLKDFVQTNKAPDYHTSQGVWGAVYKFLKSIFGRKNRTQVKLSTEDRECLDVKGFINHCKSNYVKIYLYTFEALTEASKLKAHKLIELGTIAGFNELKEPSDFNQILESERISIRNSILAVSNYTEKSILEKLPPWNYTQVVEWKNWNAILGLRDKIEYYLKGKEHSIIPTDWIILLEDTKDEMLNEYVSKNFESINQRLEDRGFQLIYFPLLQLKKSVLSKPLIELIRYRQPVLYSLSAAELNFALETILKNISPLEFYAILIEELELPYFKKPSLIRNISVSSDTAITFTYKTIEYKTKRDLDNFFNWYTEQVKHRTNNDIFFSLAKPPADYDADWHFSNESKEESEELKKKIDAFKKEGKYGALVEAIMYMLETIKEDKPEIIDKVKPLLETRKLLESKVVLSPLLIDKHYRIFLPAYGNVEVKMHALPKTVYLLFLRYPNGIRFKELYEYKAELLEIYNKVTNKYVREEIEQAIDDLVDMTKPSINQKCARIREAFRNIMDEHIAKHYYIDGTNGEPKRIALPQDLIEIRSN